MSNPSRMVIVGAGLAGAKAAEALRAEGFDAAITLIGDEADRPYERPPLSKEFLRGESEREKVFVHNDDWYSEHNVDLRLGATASAIDRAAHEVVLSGGARVGYDKLLLATGSSPRTLAIPGSDLDGIAYLRRLPDSERIRAALERGGRVAIIGGGWIGLEVAAAARHAGVDVTVLESADLPLQRVLGDEVAQVFADLHTRNGVDLRLGVNVAELVGENGTVTGVRLSDNSIIPADLVLIGVGITPNVQLAESAGLPVDNGIVVDEHLRTSDPDIFAAGDVASAFHPRLNKRIRVEHWANALNQPTVAARSMLGIEAVYDRTPYFYTDQYDLGMEYAGHVEPGGYDQVVFRGDPDSGEFVAFWVGQGRVLAGMAVNIWDVIDDIKALVESGREVDLQALADLHTPLAALVQAGSG
ncbi:MAG: FAD-dependent oxidoreductase [Candidatus Nanopelagicales bacterium]